MGFASVTHMASAISASSSSSLLLRNGHSFGASRLGLAFQTFFPKTFLARPLNHCRSLTCSRASSDEEASAIAAASSAESGAPTIFDKIISKEIPSTVVYEDERVLAFRDIDPQSPSHILLIPKIRDGLTQLSKAEPRHVDILGHLLYTAKLVAEKEGLSKGYRVVINNGPDGCQSVYHLHLHILGGRQMKWPPGCSLILSDVSEETLGCSHVAISDSCFHLVKLDLSDYLPFYVAWTRTRVSDTASFKKLDYEVSDTGVRHLLYECQTPLDTDASDFMKCRCNIAAF